MPSEQRTKNQPDHIPPTRPTRPRKKCPATARINSCRAASDASSGHHGKIFTTTSGHCMKKSSPTELRFYEGLAKRDVRPALAALRTIAPAFHGVCQLQHDNNRGVNLNLNPTTEFVVIMENIKRGMAEPMELAIKLGKYTSDMSDLLSSGMGALQAAAKTIKMRAADVLSTSFLNNFRVSGGNFLPHPELPHIVSRKQLARADFQRVLRAFFSRGNASTRRSALAGVRRVRKVLADVLADELADVDELADADELESCKRNGVSTFIGCSLIILYDAQRPSEPSRVYLLDFDHTHLDEARQGRQDTSTNKSLNLTQVIQGVDNIMAAMRHRQ